jgi:hypothetical protein
MVIVYIPIGYFMDKGIYTFRQRRKAAPKK